MQEFFKVSIDNLESFLEWENSKFGDPSNPAHVGGKMRLDKNELYCFIKYLETWDLENSQPVDVIFDYFMYGSAGFKIYEKSDFSDSEMEEFEIFFETETHFVTEY